MNEDSLEVIAEPGKRMYATRRVVDAPRGLVWEAHTRPEYLKRWLGPRDLTLVVCEIDFRVGGGYRWVHRAADGQQFAFHGVYRDITPPERIVQTFIYEAIPEREAVDTLTLKEQGGGTLITVSSVHPSVEARDAHLAAGMERGMAEGYERLDELLSELKRGIRPSAPRPYERISAAHH